MIESSPIASKPLDLAFEFSRYAISGFRCERVPFEFGWGALGGQQGAKSRECEAELLEQLAAREAEVATLVPDPHPAFEIIPAPPTGNVREALNLAFSFSERAGTIDATDQGSNDSAQIPPLELAPLLAELSAREHLIAKELAPERGAGPSREDLLAAAAYRPSCCGGGGGTLEIAKKHVALAIQDANPKAPGVGADITAWVRPGDNALCDAPKRTTQCDKARNENERSFEFTRVPASRPASEERLVDFAFSYSASILEQRDGRRIDDVTARESGAQLREDELLSQLAAAEARISAVLAVPLPPSAPEPEPGGELRERVDDQPLNFGWSGMAIAEQTGAAKRIQTVTGVAMRFRDEAFSMPIGYTR